MTDSPSSPTVNFYHLTATPQEKAVPSLLKKIFEGKVRVLFYAKGEERIRYFDNLLWTAGSDHFLPHGTDDENAADHPILIGEFKEENPNNASLIFCVEEAIPEAAEACFEKILFMFNGHNAEALQHARVLYKNYKDKGYALTYFRQDDDGTWKSD